MLLTDLEGRICWLYYLQLSLVYEVLIEAIDVVKFHVELSQVGNIKKVFNKIKYIRSDLDIRYVYFTSRCLKEGSCFIVFFVYVCIWIRPRLLIGCVLVIFLVWWVVFFLLFVFVLCLACPMLPVYLDCPFFIVPSVFSKIYLMIKISKIDKCIHSVIKLISI